MLTHVLLGLVAAWPQQPADPEASPAGRTHFLGREIAQTMHWTGAPWLLRETREDEENGALLRQWLDVPPGATVCDLGCGNGYHTLPLAAAVGPAGKVFAVELQPQMLQLLQLRAKGLALTNLVPVECTVDDPKLPSGSCDLVLMVDVYHELSHPVRVLEHVRRALKPDGRVVLVEFRAEDPDVPIKPEHKMDKAQIVREMAAHGFACTATFDGLPWQHAMSFSVAATPGPRLMPREVVRGLLAAVAGGERRAIVPWLARPELAAALPSLAADLPFELRAAADGAIVATVGTHGLVLVVDDAGRWLVDAVRPATPWRRAHGAERPFVAMHTGTGGGAIGEQAALVRELGFDGLEWGLADVAAARRECEARGGDLFAVYAVLDVGDAFASENGTEAAVVEAMRELAGGPGMLWLALQCDGVAPRDPAGDQRAAAALASLLRATAATGVEIALYPHHGCWLETVDDALRVAGSVDDPRLGVCFNLCHFLRTGDDPDPAPALRRCGRRLFAVTVNGADRDGADWGSLIRPLGEGDADVRALLAMLDAMQFTGPIGLQGFGIQRPAREHLGASMAAWRQWHAR